jgi:CubicO group peptidase (beta-lactamase class C family)
MSASPRCGACAALLVGLTAAAFGLAPARGAAPRYHPRQGASIPIVTLTSTAPGYRAIESGMARFILLLQANERAAAARLLSRRMDVGHRRAFVQGKWLTRTSAADFGIVYFLPAIRIRTRGVAGTRAIVRVEPLTPFAPQTMAIGFIEVPMYRENGRWRVDPTPVAIRRTAKRPARK